MCIWLKFDLRLKLERINYMYVHPVSHIFLRSCTLSHPPKTIEIMQTVHLNTFTILWWLHHNWSLNPSVVLVKHDGYMVCMLAVIVNMDWVSRGTAFSAGRFHVSGVSSSEFHGLKSFPTVLKFFISYRIVCLLFSVERLMLLFIIVYQWTCSDPTSTLHPVTPDPWKSWYILCMLSLCTSWCMNVKLYLIPTILCMVM